jgi:aerotaxis receptor
MESHKIESQIDFDQIVHSHSSWKYLLKNVIESGRSELSVVDARDMHCCVFGQWLDSPAGNSLPHYSKVVELHRHFHEEAANVLDLALQGQSHQASEALKLGSPFNQATASLINELSEIRKMVESGQSSKKW